MQNFNHIKVKPISGAMGAEVFDVDLSSELSSETWNEIKEAFHNFLVLIFRDQNLTDQQQFNFTQRFGKLIPHPYVKGLPEIPEIFKIIREPGESYSWDGFYHSDLMFLKKPPLGATLYAKECPPFGADTAFTNMYLAYDTLSDGMKDLLDGLEAENESGNPEKYSNRYQSMEELGKKGAMGAVHPMVRVHPGTGKKALFSSLAFTKRIKGMTDKESAPILNFLYEHSKEAHLGCRLQWEKGSLALWDNRVCLHHAVADYFGEVSKHRRVMQRCTIEGEEPISVKTYNKSRV
ncbi:MAG: TauD/TfdA family dioxygenase [Rhodobacteraceae bacterium]|nr:TauD/TfdA family dioxygenase [Paracoccaceae bacterium]